MKQTSFTLLASLTAVFTAGAASNFVPGAVINQESVVLAGPFDHGAGAGDPSNSTTTATFVGGFTANAIQVDSTLNPVIAATWGNEPDLNLTDQGAAATTQYGFGGPAGTYTGPLVLSGVPVGIAPVAAAGAWNLEFIDTFDDGAGTDSTSSAVTVTLIEQTASVESNSVEAMGTIANGGTAGSVGEFGLPGFFDSYTFTLAVDGDFSAETVSLGGTGLLGTDADTEIALFDAAGNFLSENDDTTGRFSFIGQALTAGDYTLHVGGFNTAFGATTADTVGGAALGDYGVNFALIPEPGSVALFLTGGLALMLRRRR